MKPTLQFRLSQHLTLTPQLQQSIRLLQLSTVELNQEIERILMDNPALEREDAGEEHEASAAPERRGDAPAAEAPAAAPAESAPEAQLSEGDWSLELAGGWRGGDDEDGERNFSAPDTPTLREHLRGQLTLLKIGERDRAFVEILIDALDDDGYLTQSLEEIAALLPPEILAEADELSIALHHLQNLEPAGVGARSPAECLALQLKNCGDEAHCKLALEIVQKHLELLANRDYTRLKSLTGAADDELRAAQRLIQALNPRPGSAFARVEARYVVPDVVVRKSRGAWRASLNPEAMPRLRINRLYAELAAGARASGAGLSSQ
ncbi:MAG TPA: RNA polymerase factor sigma-54, partial [Burkholderiales bacterium]|nr:RNA polymerase factor sigma-54 [Burkholderiales bacterium]